MMFGWSRTTSAIAFSSSRLNTLPVGLCGEFSSSTFVLAVIDLPQVKQYFLLHDIGQV